MKAFLSPETILLHVRKYSIVFFILLAGGVVRAGTWYVKPAPSGTGSGNSWANASASLAAIITGAASGDQVWVAAGTYVPGGAATSTFQMKTGVLVYGGFAGGEVLLSARNWATNVTILSGNNVCYNVVTSSGVSGTTTLDGFTITKGIASGGTTTGGGIYDNGSTITYANCIITVNTAVGNGGGAYVSGGGTVTFTNCTFSSNSTTAALSTTTGGGGFANVGGTAVFTGCTFSNNTSSSAGGGVFNYNSGNTTMTSCTFTGNVAGGDGGGIANQAATAYLTGCTLTSNLSNHNANPGGGGGAYTNSGNGIQLSNCVFQGNTAYSFGGGYLDNGGSSLGTTYCTFTNNIANYGGGIYSFNGTSPGVQNSYFSNNLAHVAGGGIFTNNVGAGNLVIDTFYNNTADDTAYHSSPVAGGGVCNAYASNVGIVHCIFQGNVASNGDGGGLYELNISNNNDSSDIFMANVANNGNGGGLVDSAGNTKFFKSVFADNQASQYGGGAYISNNSGTLESCTFYNNKANSSGAYGDGIYEASGANFKILGNIIWSSSSTSGLVGAAVGSKVQYNDISHGTVYNGSNGNIMLAPTFGNSGNYIGADGLWETADDGLHLVNGSNGTDLVISGDYFNVTDITEAARPDGGGTLADMGAYEGPGSFVVLAVDSSTAASSPVMVRTTQPAGQLSLRPTVATQGARVLYIRLVQTASVNLTLMDLSGRLVWKRAVVLGAGDNYLPIDVSAMPAGLYYLQARGPGIQSQAVTMEKL